MYELAVDKISFNYDVFVTGNRKVMLLNDIYILAII